jgi:hypothetical protein
MLSEYPLSRSLVAMTSFTSRSGFDYLVLVDSGRLLFVVDPGRLAIDHSVYRSRHAIIGVGFDADRQEIVLMDQQGQIVALHKDWE